MYEHRSHPLLSRTEFLWRVARHTVAGFLAIIAALLIGMIGYHVLGDLGWVDAFLNASMILGGMGPVDPLHGAAAKLFAGAYALFSGLFFIALMGVLLAPFVHRLIHRFHMEDDEARSGDA